MVVHTILVIMACTSHPTTSPTPAIEAELTLTQKLKNTLDDSLYNSSVPGVSSTIIMLNEQIFAYNLNISHLRSHLDHQPGQLSHNPEESLDHNHQEI